jgi:hypothetical protein
MPIARLFPLAVFAAALILSGLPACGAEAPETPAQRREKELGGVKAEPLNADWEYSTNGGQIYNVELPATVEVENAPAFFARATFTVADPAAVAGLWLAHDDPNNLAAFCLGSHLDARDRDCGAKPLWTFTKVTLNGKRSSARSNE